MKVLQLYGSEQLRKISRIISKSFKILGIFLTQLIWSLPFQFKYCCVEFGYNQVEVVLHIFIYYYIAKNDS
jgi:hypothetical protein